MTITEHFEQAKKDGHEWADAAIKYRKYQLYGNDDKQNCSGLITAILHGFVWSKTKEGKKYWEKIREQLYNED
jgi:hypothetical protein